MEQTLLNEYRKLTPEMEEYANAIRQLADDKSEQEFMNSGPEHAAIVLSNIFRTAEKNIKIFAGDLCGSISNNPTYLESLKDMLNNRDVKVHVLLESMPGPQSEAYKVFIDSRYHDKVSISIADPKKVSETISLEKKVHFTVADDRMYRFETDTTNFTAVCSFHDTKFSKTLNRVFDLINR